MRRNPLLRRARILQNRLRFTVRVEKIDGKRQLVVHRTLRRAVALLRIGITLIGLLSAFIVFSPAWVAFAFGLLLWLLASGLERSVFSYRDLYVMPLPDFELQPESWLGMAFGYHETPDRQHRLPTAGMVLSDPEYAQKVYRLLHACCRGELDDSSANLAASIVLHSSDRYSFFLYPNPAPRAAQEPLERAEAEPPGEEPTQIQDQLFVSLVLGKDFDITPTSSLPAFVDSHRAETPVVFQLYVLRDGQPTQAPGTETILLHGLVIKQRDALTRRDIEFPLIR